MSLSRDLFFFLASLNALKESARASWSSSMEGVSSSSSLSISEKLGIVTSLVSAMRHKLTNSSSLVSSSPSLESVSSHVAFMAFFGNLFFFSSLLSFFKRGHSGLICPGLWQL
ncbi:hypothetical protein U1Q18_052606 [Sarracenia purpurea var. burkii]